MAKRNFYGVLSVAEYGGADSENLRRNLYNGRILHGVQFRQPDKRDIATTYYSAQSGVGLTLANIGGPEPVRVATVGLGPAPSPSTAIRGTTTASTKSIPRSSTLRNSTSPTCSDCPAEVHIELGDARLSMEQQSPQSYDVIALDAFSGDAIPAHLLTVEAFAVYRRHLKPSGVIAVHTSNRHLNLRPIVALIAQHYQMQVMAVYAEDETGRGRLGIRLVAGHQQRRVSPTAATSLRRRHRSNRPTPTIRVWTDQYSNLFQILTVGQKWKKWWYWREVRHGRTAEED